MVRYIGIYWASKVCLQLSSDQAAGDSIGGNIDRGHLAPAPAPGGQQMTLCDTTLHTSYTTQEEDR